MPRTRNGRSSSRRALARTAAGYRLAVGRGLALAGEIKADESYFGGKRKGKLGHGGAGKVPVFGILKRGGKVYAKLIPDARTETLMPIMNPMSAR